MAYKTDSSFLAQIFILSILLAVTGQAVAGRGTPKVAKNADVKQPGSLLGSDQSLLIPGIGRVMLPKGLGTPYNLYTGGDRIGGSGHTFVPNSGFKVPSPGSVPTEVHP